MQIINDSWKALKRDMKAIGEIKGRSWKLWWGKVKDFQKGDAEAVNLTRDYNIRSRAVALKNANS